MVERQHRQTHWYLTPIGAVVGALIGSIPIFAYPHRLPEEQVFSLMTFGGGLGVLGGLCGYVLSLLFAGTIRLVDVSLIVALVLSIGSFFVTLSVGPTTTALLACAAVGALALLVLFARAMIG